MKMEIYFHIPFCVRKCLYCDFLSAPADAAVQDAYMEALLRETTERAREYKEYTVDTVFIGGGTPSVVDAVWIERLMEAVRGNFALAENAEVTMEVNPGTVDQQKLERYWGAGINRLSIGLQSADNEELRQLGRIHTWEDFAETYRLAGRVGFTNLNVDIMSALPGQSLASYRNTLKKVLDLKPQPKHISAYSLIVEEGTPFAKLHGKGLLNLPDEECERRMYQQTAEILGYHGYERYEISNYAKKGYECRHNCGYWRRVEYVGFGIGAASLVKNERFQNQSNLQVYLENPLGCRSERQLLSLQEQMEEFMFLGLRMTQGILEQEFRENFGKWLDEVYGSVIDRNLKDGLLQYRKDHGRLALTKKGMDLSNYVMAQFLLD